MTVQIEITGRLRDEIERIQEDFPEWDLKTLIQYLLSKGIIERKREL